MKEKDENNENLCQECEAEKNISFFSVVQYTYMVVLSKKPDIKLTIMGGAHFQLTLAASVVVADILGRGDAGGVVLCARSDVMR